MASSSRNDSHDCSDDDDDHTPHAKRHHHHQQQQQQMPVINFNPDSFIFDLDTVDGFMDAEMLHRNLKIKYPERHFGKDICHAMISLYTTHCSNKIELKEYNLLTAKIREWDGVFFRHVGKGHHKLPEEQLRRALNQYFETDFSAEAMALVMDRFGDSHHRDCVGKDHFVACCAKIAAMKGCFEDMKDKKSGTVAMGYDTFFRTVMKL